MQTVFRPTEAEIRYIERIGRARYEYAVNNGFADQPSLIGDISGFAGECYSGRCYGAKPQENVGVIDPGWDLVIHHWYADVKTTQGHYQYLRVKEKKPLACDLLVLARCDWPHRVEISGWITAQGFREECDRLKKIPNSRCMHIDRLEKPHDLLPWAYWVWEFESQQKEKAMSDYSGMMEKAQLYDAAVEEGVIPPGWAPKPPVARGTVAPASAPEHPPSAPRDRR